MATRSPGTGMTRMAGPGSGTRLSKSSCKNPWFANLTGTLAVFNLHIPEGVKSSRLRVA